MIPLIFVFHRRKKINKLARKKEKRKEKFSVITVFTGHSVVVVFFHVEKNL